ncbi:hypothetical protein SYJ56_22740 [Algoriphagus sp. D3-2-R+10]|uniref:hypothetical protein n=1 Tax=Algoriphagus aurantiacus TaxID=3103948 RepID=UPI002B3F3BC1|nr:hypothetical protein [Algoriphagus sp. D3-2-R+10]MEB2778147.1 hypothetical protein [Algoriphagus sp. D3-2-R+10]
MAIPALLAAIEEKLNRGKSENWTQYDFEQLSEAIFEAIHVRLSVTTLKRIWGKVKNTHTPAVQTLNTLSQFAGYIDWRDFEQNYTRQDILEMPEASNTKSKRKPVPPTRLVWSLVGVLFISVIYFGFQRVMEPDVNPAEYSFSLSKIKTTGVPNSVVFSYDASKSPSDSVYIVQTWDIRRKTLVPKNGKKHSAIYYYPGFFNTKLIINNQVVSNQDLQISTDGWLGLIETPDKPIYFSQEEIQSVEGVKVGGDLLQNHQIATEPSSPKVRFFNQQDLGDLMNDTYEFETEIRNPNQRSDNVCHFVEVLIQCKNDIIIIPLADSACVGDLGLAYLGHYLEAKYEDLSGFGADLREWTKLKIISRNGKAEIFVNDSVALEVTAKNTPVGIVGVQYRFYGEGEIRYANFRNKNGQVIQL